MQRKQLVVHLDHHSVRFVRMVDGTNEQTFSFSFTDKSDFGYKDQLDAFLTKTDFRTMEWDEFSLGWFSPKSTLVPYNLFAQSEPSDLFKFSFGAQFVDNDIDFNRIPENTLVNVYEIPLWVKSFFVSRFPRMVIQHAGTHVIRGLFNGGTYGLKINILVEGQHFLMAALQKNQLMMYNHGSAESATDLLYHLVNLIQQQNWENEKGKVEYSISGADWSEEWKTLFLKFPVLKKLSLQPNQELLNQYQLLCV